MRTIQYKNFSLYTHKLNWRAKKPNVCQFELTFKCGLHCRHCYSDCYNDPSCIKNELNTKDVKLIIDKVHKMGVLWLCFTGGDPLEREDFLDIYSYAKDKGFLLTVFTNSYSMTEKIADYFKKNMPFVVEITINGASKEVYERVTAVKDSYAKAMTGLEMMLERNIPLKVKTMATKQNLEGLPKIKEFLETKGLKFRPSSLLHARLNSDKAPCNLRLSPEDILGLDRLFGVETLKEDEEDSPIQNEHKRQFPRICHSEGAKPSASPRGERPKNLKERFFAPPYGGAQNDRVKTRLFRCSAGGGDGINLDPYGNMFICSCIRKPAINFLEAGLPEIEKMRNTFTETANLEFKTDSKCRTCGLIGRCHLCPGKALLETGDMEAPVEYFCEMARETVKLSNC